jgi:hypothetical protein
MCGRDPAKACGGSRGDERADGLADGLVEGEAIASTAAAFGPAALDSYAKFA